MLELYEGCQTGIQTALPLATLIPVVQIIYIIINLLCVTTSDMHVFVTALQTCTLHNLHNRSMKLTFEVDQDVPSQKLCS